MGAVSGTAPPAQVIRVKSEYDVIALRQAVRQMAREVGLGLAQQARITAAISEVARVLLRDAHDLRVTVRVSYREPRPALQVICGAPESGGGVDHAALLREVQALVDAAEGAPHDAQSWLMMQMWIGRN